MIKIRGRRLTAAAEGAALRLAALLLTTIILTGSVLAEPFSSTRADDLRERILFNEDRLLLLTPAALYRFLPATETWTTATATEGLPGAPLTGIAVTDEELWLTGDGAAFSDLRFDDWQRYGAGEGYPGRFIRAVASDADYVYAACDGGAARFDRYILEWESLTGPDGTELGALNDVASDEDRVWFARNDGVAEFRKEAESMHLETQLGRLDSPRVLALRQTTNYLWAITDRGFARYDKELKTWTSFTPGDDLPDTRIHRLEMQGEDIWLGTDRGLWRFRAETGIWRREESCVSMPGESVRAFALDGERLWVVTDLACALYEEENARWIDFTAALPLEFADIDNLAFLGKTLVLTTPDAILYGLDQGQSSPNLFTFRSRPIQKTAIGSAAERRITLDERGLSLRVPGDGNLLVQGGATTYIENDVGTDETGLGEMITDTRVDLSLSGRFGEDRTLSGFYDGTDPDNHAYQLTYRGARRDVLRSLSVGELGQQLFNSELAPGTGLTGGSARLEFGERSETTNRRLLTADAWFGLRRTLSGRDVFHGNNRDIAGSVRDIDYVRGTVFPLPTGWTAGDLAAAEIHRDDNDDATDNANTKSRTFAGISGNWDRLTPNTDYVLGPDGRTLVLDTPLQDGDNLVARRGASEVDLTDTWLRNRYFVALSPVPGTLRVTMVDSLGADHGVGGNYLYTHGLDADNDGRCDTDRFSPLTGLIDFPTDTPFASEAYADPPTSNMRIEYSYKSTLSTFILSRRDIVPGSERVTLDRRPVQAGADYSLIPTSGIFVFFDHVVIDDDTVIEIEYEYELDTSDPDYDDSFITTGQLGFAPIDNVFLGVNSTIWTDDQVDFITTTDFNARFEWRGADHFLRVSPEFAVSDGDTSQESPSAASVEQGSALGVDLQGRFRGLEFSASHRDLGENYVSLEDRRTLLGRLREETRAQGLWQLGTRLQAELDWSRSLSDQVAAGSNFGSDSEPDVAGGEGEESALTAGVRLQQAGLPSVLVSRGQMRLAAPGRRQDKTISRVELQYDPEVERISALGLRRLWLRAFFQRSERDFTSDAQTSDPTANRGTDHASFRLNGSTGVPLSWNIAFEDKHTWLPGGDDLGRNQQLDAMVQIQPHSSLDTYLRWEGERDLFRRVGGDRNGFGANRTLLGTIQFYPGRISERFSRLALRVDLNNASADDGEPGLAQPGFAGLWTESDPVSRQIRTRNSIFEARVQVLANLRLVERLTLQSSTSEREELRTDGDGWELENRLEVKPDGGQVMVRVFGSRFDEVFTRTEGKRFSGQWDQIWGRGLLTYASLEAFRNESTDRDLGEISRGLTPKVQFTWRYAKWRLDANLGATLSWLDREDTSLGAPGGWLTDRQQTLSFSLDVNPHRILFLKVQYMLGRSQSDLTADSVWDTNHDLRIRLQIRV
ncbi:MAG: hypothetical protein GY835_14205 [bacterium]|nr:hypothetical protein [bacterium]